MKEEQASEEEGEPEHKTAEEMFRKVLISTIVGWAEEAQFELPKLVREMFRWVKLCKGAGGG